MCNGSLCSPPPLLYAVDYSSDRLAVPYDPDAFDSMAVMNSELWNLGEGDEGCVTSTDLLPNVRNNCNIDCYPKEKVLYVDQILGCVQ